MVLRNIAPLPGTFLLMSIIGFIITTVYILGGRFNNSDFALSLAVAFDVVFVVMFIASVLSITPTEPVEAPVAKEKVTAKKRPAAKTRRKKHSRKRK